MRRVFLFPAAVATVVATIPGAAQATSTTCATSVVCAEYINTYSGSSGGVAIHGEADGGIGIRGTSVTNAGFYGASGSGTLFAPGVEGESTNNSGMDAGGAFGLAGLAAGGKYPRYGAVGYGSSAGLAGQTNLVATGTAFGAGVLGIDATSSSGDAGVIGTSGNGAGGVFEANANIGALTEFPVGVLAVAQPFPAKGAEAIGIESESSDVALTAVNTSTTNGYYVELATPNDLIYANNEGKSFYVTTAGNAYLSGTITTSGGTFVRMTGGSGATRVAYGARTTTPQIEDVGEGTLVNGRAAVAIDPDLADSIDLRRAYHVFLTPDGDCKGLYVAQKSPSGFVVRELQGGRSNLTFEYRLVAKPSDENGERLARTAALPEPSHPLPALVAKRAPILLNPEARLEQRLGPQGYAKLIAELSRRIAGK